MWHAEPCSKQLAKSRAESAVSELGGLHKLKWGCIWQFGECSRQTLLFSTGCTTRSSTAEATKSHTFLNPLDYTMSRDWKGPVQASTADDMPPNISHLQQHFAKCYLNDKQALYHNFYIFLFTNSHKRRKWPKKNSKKILKMVIWHTNPPHSLT